MKEIKCGGGGGWCLRTPGLLIEGGLLDWEWWQRGQFVVVVLGRTHPVQAALLHGGSGGCGCGDGGLGKEGGGASPGPCKTGMGEGAEKEGCCGGHQHCPETALAAKAPSAFVTIPDGHASCCWPAPAAVQPGLTTCPGVNTRWASSGGRLSEINSCCCSRGKEQLVVVICGVWPGRGAVRGTVQNTRASKKG